MTVKEFLNEVRDQHFKLRSLRRLRAQARESIIDLKGQNYDHTKITGTKDSSLDDTIARLMEITKDYDEKINRQITQLALFRRESIKMIEEIKDKSIQSLFMDHYMGRMSWQDITQDRFDTLHYKNQFLSLKRLILRQHGEGLKFLSDKHLDCTEIFEKCSAGKEEENDEK